MSEKSQAKDFVTGTDEVGTTSSADNITPPVNMPTEGHVDTPENSSIGGTTKDIAARAAFYLQHYGLMAGAFVVGTALTIVIIKKVIRRRNK